VQVIDSIPERSVPSTMLILTTLSVHLGVMPLTSQVALIDLIPTV